MRMHTFIEIKLILGGGGGHSLLEQVYTCNNVVFPRRGYYLQDLFIRHANFEVNGKLLWLLTPYE